jgi:hypothetical protein
MTDRRVIELEVQLELRDYLQANYWYLFNRMPFGLLLVLAIVMVPLTCCAVFLFPQYWPGLLTPLVVPVGTLVVFLSVYFGARRSMKSNKALEQMVRYRFSPDGIDTVAPSSSGHVNWDLVFQAVETKHSFLVFIARSLMFVIPKRCFQDGEPQMEDFRQLLREQVAERAKF